MAAYDEKLRYPTDINAVELEAAYPDRIFMFSYLDTQIVGTLFAGDNDGYMLRVKTIEGHVHKIGTYVDIYPEMGLITFAAAFDIKSNF